jgi:hypothetical protein
MQSGGYFRDFHPVAPMVATFPSISDPNWARIVRCRPEVSYTVEHFDHDLNGGKGGMTGGLVGHVFRPPLYESKFDLRPDGPIAHLASMAYSETSGLYWLDTIEKRLFRSRKSVYRAFIVNTDFIAHTKGEKGVFRYLAELDKKLTRLRQHYRETFGRELEVILVSDHGNVFLKPKPVDVDPVLKADGWNPSNTLNTDRDVVYVVPEILSFAPFFVNKGREEALALTLSRVEGVHVSLYASKISEGSAAVDFFSRGGKDRTRALLNLKKRTVDYRLLKGEDPFGQLKYFKKGPLPFSRYFQLTLGDDYPNALVRAYEGLETCTIQRPSVLVSPRLGRVFSNKTLELLTKVMGLESVHGSFHRSESLGIFVSTARDLPAVSPADVLDFVH